MHWELVASVFGALAPIATLLNAWITNGVRMEITNLKLEISEKRNEDMARMEEKFMPRTEIEQKFRTMEARIGIKIT